MLGRKVEDAIAALPADDRVAKLVDALFTLKTISTCAGTREYARAALAEWEAGNE
jgi:hypothetical protein